MPEPPAGAAASSPDSATDLLGDAGPAFVAVDAPEPAGPGVDARALAGGDLWTEPRVKGLLMAKGELLHGAIAVDKASDEWRYTQADLAVIAPALTRILNRYDATKAAAAAGDEMAVAVGFAGYAARSYSQRRHALRLLEAPEPAPVGDGDPDWQASTHPDVDQLAADMVDAAAGAAPEFPSDHDTPPIAAPRRY